MGETTQELGKCGGCGKDINLEDSWRVDEKFLCQDCFEKINL